MVRFLNDAKHVSYIGELGSDQVQGLRKNNDHFNQTYSTDKHLDFTGLLTLPLFQLRLKIHKKCLLRLCKFKQLWQC